MAQTMSAAQFQYPDLPQPPPQNPSAPQPSSPSPQMGAPPPPPYAVATPNAAQPPAPVTVALSTIVVPAGASPGQQINVMMPDGQSVMVAVPEGILPGMQINVQYQPRGQQQQQVGQQQQPGPTATASPAQYNYPNHQTSAQQQHRQHSFQQFPAFVGSSLPVPTANSPEHLDQEAAKIGWIIYVVGWLCCCFCPALAPCLWCAAVWMHFCKPSSQRTQMPRQERVAKCSAITLCTMMALGVLFLIGVMCLSFTGAYQHCHYPCRLVVHDYNGFPKVHHGPINYDMDHPPGNEAQSLTYHGEGVHPLWASFRHHHHRHFDHGAQCVCPQHNGTVTTTVEPIMEGKHNWVSEDSVSEDPTALNAGQSMWI